MTLNYKLTEYSHGAGCGCKLSPGVLADIIGVDNALPVFPDLLVGNETKDDAAVVSLDGKMAIVSTTDFFMPIVDDAVDFGAIAATNAISDIYAMGAEPIMAIAILGWPIDKLPASVASQVMSGARRTCSEAGIPLAGGHSIDAPEPIFGLAVTGKVAVDHVKKNTDGRVGDLLYLTKPLGIGIVTTAQKKKVVELNDLEIAKKSMTTLNKIGQKLGQLDYVNALTDVTGFGIGGHLLEVCDASEVSAVVHKDQLPVFNFVDKYLELGCVSGGTNRNWATYGERISLSNKDDYQIIADPQTSGGLLVSVDPKSKSDFESFMLERGFELEPIGELRERSEYKIVEVI
ncbi:MAG: selenide, water dikinase SelD [Cytophagales bacterium]|nr:selenide, water dikinase SelD [Cytophagales bacterium]